jgi:hypothetical protein
MTKQDLENEYELEKGEGNWDFNTQNYKGDYVDWLEGKLVKNLTIPVVVGQSEQLPDTCQDWVRKDGEKCIFTGMCQKCK